MGNKIKVDGIKLSQELVHIQMSSRPGKMDPNARFLRSMADHRINVSFLSYSAMDPCAQGSYCIAGEDAARLNQILDKDPDLKAAVTCLSSVGSISLFPHRFSLKLIGCLMRVFGEAGLPLYGMAASLSALTLTTDYAPARPGHGTAGAAHKPSPEPCPVWLTTQDKVALTVFCPEVC